jgi:hypothetical protein
MNNTNAQPFGGGQISFGYIESRKIGEIPWKSLARRRDAAPS